MNQPDVFCAPLGQVLGGTVIEYNGEMIMLLNSNLTDAELDQVRAELLAQMAAQELPCAA